MARAPDTGAFEEARKSLGLLTIPSSTPWASPGRGAGPSWPGTLVPLGRGVFRHCAWSGSWERLVLAAVLEAGGDRLHRRRRGDSSSLGRGTPGGHGARRP